MSTTLTIRNLDEAVKQKLRLRAASHSTSMEAEARAILTQAVNDESIVAPPRSAEKLEKRLGSVIGRWKNQGTTDELMHLTRGEN